MGRRDFNEHLAEAQLPEKIATREAIGIRNLKLNDSEGQLSFEYTHASLQHPLFITVLIPDISSYPKMVAYMIFLHDDLPEGAGSQIPQMLDKLGSQLEDMPIDDIFPAIAERLDLQLTGGDFSETEGQSDSGDFDDATWSNDSDYDDLNPNEADKDRQDIELNGTLEMQEKDLTAALAAGVSVGVYETIDTHHTIMSLSIPVSGFGMDPERLEAWGLSGTDFVVLLIKTCAGGYPSTGDYLERQRPQELYRFALGKCSSSKPSERSAQDAVRGKSSDANTSAVLGSSATSCGYADFQPLYLFNSIERTLQNDLASLIKIRLKDDSLSWSEALTYFLTAEKVETAVTHDEALATPQGRRILHQHTLGSADSLSIPLVAMNCAVYLMARSGQHCVICGRPLPVGFETMRPYICDRDLCLDQYFSLNLGPGIEHEIINNPHAVDLLVGFFYSALLSDSASQFPKALRLKGPGCPAPDKPDIQASIQYQDGKGEAKLLGNMSVHEKAWLQPGTKILLLAAASRGPDIIPQPPQIPEQKESSSRKTTGRCYHHSMRLLCTITEVFGHVFNFKADAFWDGPHTSHPVTPPIVNTTHQPSPLPGGYVKLPEQMYVMPFTQDIGDLTNGARDMALFTILCGLPSILSIREFLVQNPRKRLASSPLVLDPVTYRLLLWIVASNRSFIVQDEPVTAQQDQARLDSRNAPHRVKCMDAGWLQFRFVQGSPEKEQRFAQELNKVHEGRGPKPRSLFAWHGSSLNNWHGIVSTGLNYDRALNGRSYGNGVYFSERLSTSLGFSRSDPGLPWPNSDIRVSQAISMCEIVNRKEEFVCTDPHMVVNKLDWIQCRFLFVRVNPTAAAADPQVCFPQGSKFTEAMTKPKYLTDTTIVNEMNEPLQIPESAIPSRIKGSTPKDSSPKKERWSLLGKRRSGGSEATACGLDDGKGVDLDGVLKATQPSSSTPGQCPSKRLKEDQDATDFVPGTLDWTLMSKLPDPVLPSSRAQKVLAQEIKTIAKVQSDNNLAESGWYIDLEKLQELGNLFRWVVELHSFDKDLPLARDMKKKGCKSIVLELNFGSTYPMAPPFARIIRPRFLEFTQGGGGNVTAGGSICSEMLVTEGWSPALGIEKVILQIRLQLCDMERPARLKFGGSSDSDYSVAEALEAYKRAAAAHGWSVSSDVNDMSARNRP